MRRTVIWNPFWSPQNWRLKCKLRWDDGSFFWVFHSCGKLQQLNANWDERLDCRTLSWRRWRSCPASRWARAPGRSPCTCAGWSSSTKGNCIKIGLPGKSILRDYFQENGTSWRPFLLLRTTLSGRPIFIQFIPGAACPPSGTWTTPPPAPGSSATPSATWPPSSSWWPRRAGGNCIKIGLPGKSILRDFFSRE